MLRRDVTAADTPTLSQVNMELDFHFRVEGLGFECRSLYRGLYFEVSLGVSSCFNSLPRLPRCAPKLSIELAENHLGIHTVLGAFEATTVDG